MNEDEDQRQDGDENLDETVQKMFADLKSLLAKKKSKNIITTIKQRIDDLCDDVESNNSELPDASNSAESSVDVAAPPNAHSTENKKVEIKNEVDDKIVGTIKVKNLSQLMDPNRNKNIVEETIVLSDSDEEQFKEIGASTETSDNSIVRQNADNGSICDISTTIPISMYDTLSSDHVKHSSKEKVENNENDNISNKKSQSSKTKSILKSPIKSASSPEKKVKFSKNDAEVHTYARYIPSATESSSEDTSSDEEFTIKSTKKKKPRSKQQQLKEPTNVQYADHIRQDKKYFSKCVVNVPRFSIDNLSNLLNKGAEDESRTDEIKRMDNMDGLKRKHLERNGKSSDTDDNDCKQKRASKRLKKKETWDKHGLEENGDSEKISTAKSDDSSDSDVEEDKDEDKLPVGKHFISTESDEIQENSAPDTSETNESTKLFSSDSEEEEEESVKTAIKKKTRAKRVISDSEDSSGEPPDDSSINHLDSSDGSEKEEKKSSAKKSKKRSRIKKVNDSSDEEEMTTRKQIRKVISRDSLADTTKQAERDEAERKARIAEKQAKYNNIFDPKDLENSTQSKVVLDFNDETQEELLSVDEELVKHLKPHQAKGIQFMWDACFESIERTKTTGGSGCILAHCMGLGKTLQVIALTHTLLSNRDKTNVSKVLVVCPLSTVLNWVAEYKQWLPDDDEVQVYNLVSYKQNRERISHIMDWHKHGGALILGYDMFRNLSNETNKRVTKKMRLDFCKALVDPGPDLVVCDEGHLLKNGNTSLSKAMNRIRTLRRIILTGTPLQNNLKEYHCMVQFVKPNLLGTYKEYLNRFVNPITNGQYTDSTQADINLMRKRSHVLHKLLDGTVQRRDYAVLAPFLPPKHEYVVFISLTQTQQKLYQHYLANFAQRSAAGRTSLFADFQELQRICTHPRVLLDKSLQNKALAEKKWDDEEDEADDSEGSLKNFIDDSDEESDAKSTSSDSGSDEKTSAPNKYKRTTRATAQNEPEEAQVEAEVEAHTEWWNQFTEGDELHNIVHSGKLSLLFEILHQCELIGDKILVFSQSLLSLNVIEYFLSIIDEAAQSGDSSMVKGYSGSWSLGLDYFRLDGSSSCDNRAAWCKTFNDPRNTRARLFLISTRAGGLGINLVAANRVIIFDVSWNPSHDIQSIYRVYRFGQIKPSFIYRFVTLGTMEMKVYERQVTKQAISKRVIDEQQIDRHYNQNDLQELYKFEPQPSERPPPVPPKDILLGELLQNFDDIIFKYHEHQSLLENKEDEVLNEEERKAAWEEFENEKKMHRSVTGTINNIPMHTVVQALSSILAREHPNLTQQEINGVMPQLINELRVQLADGDMGTFNKMLAEIRSIKAAEQARVQEYFQQQQHGMLLAHLQRQYPGLNPADIERFMRAQMVNAQYSSFSGRPPVPRTTATPTVSNPPITISSEIVNLDED